MEAKEMGGTGMREVPEGVGSRTLAACKKGQHTECRAAYFQSVSGNAGAFRPAALLWCACGCHDQIIKDTEAGR